MAQFDIARTRGSICALITPFADGKVDLAAYRAIVRWQIESGTVGLVPCGTTGETPTITREEWRAMVTICVEEGAGKVPVIAGTGSNDTSATIERTVEARGLGADAVLIVTPYYNRPDQNGLYAHYRAIHDNTDLPIITYDVPGRTNVLTAVETLARLAELPRIVGTKDATGNVSRVDRVRAACGPDFLQFSGEDATALGYNAHGGHGCISVTANAAPYECAQLQTTSLAGDYEAARMWQDKLILLHDALFCEPSPQPVKYAVSRRGFCRDELRLPLVPASLHARARVDAALSYAGIELPEEG